MSQLARAAGTGGSVVVDRCQVCDSTDLESVLFLGYLPPVNQMRTIGEKPHEQPAYPAEMLRCRTCTLVQLGLIVDPAILFPPEYPYTSGTTRILRENFAEMQREAAPLLGLTGKELVVDVGSNDGTLLQNFLKAGHPVCGVEPTLMANLANQNGIRSLMKFFNPESAAQVVRECGKARVVTATNVFAHIEHVHDIVEGVVAMLDAEGVFISESHYLMSLIETVQYDTIYHEHVFYFSLTALKPLFERHGLSIFHVERLRIHGGSLRLFACIQGAHREQSSVANLLEEERRKGLDGLEYYQGFANRVQALKRELVNLLHELKQKGKSFACRVAYETSYQGCPSTIQVGRPR